MRTVTYSAEFRRETVEELLVGQKRASQICRDRGIDFTTLRRWRLAYEEHGQDAWTPPKPEDTSAEAKIAQLERMIGQLTMEAKAMHFGLAHLNRSQGFALLLPVFRGNASER